MDSVTPAVIADVSLNARCARLVRHLLSVVEGLYPALVMSGPPVQHDRSRRLPALQQQQRAEEEEEAELRDLAFGAIEGGQAFEQERHSGRGSPAQRSPAPRTGSPQHFAATPTGMRFSASPVFSSPSDGIYSPGREQEIDAEMSVLKGGGKFPGGRSPQPPWPEEQQQQGVWLPAETVRMQKAQMAAMEQELSRLRAQQQEE